MNCNTNIRFYDRCQIVNYLEGLEIIKNPQDYLSHNANNLKFDCLKCNDECTISYNRIVDRSKNNPKKGMPTTFLCKSCTKEYRFLLQLKRAKDMGAIDLSEYKNKDSVMQFKCFRCDRIYKKMFRSMKKPYFCTSCLYKRR